MSESKLNYGDGNDRLFIEACSLHKLGIEGDKEAVRRSHDMFRQLYDKDPQNHLFEAYLGSVTTLLGRDAVDPNERTKLALKGLKLLDHAVSAEPENIEIRSLRGNVCLRLPETYFHRTNTAIEDFKYLVSRYETGDGLLTEEYYWQVLYDLGCAYKELNQLQDSRTVWEKLLAATTDPKYRKLVQSGGSATPSLAQMPVQIPVERGKKKDITEGVRLHCRAFESGSELQAVQQALKFFESAYQESPDDPVIAAYYADCLSLTARHANDPSSMFSSAIKAFKIFDDAVNSAPDCIEARLIRGIHSLRIPETFFKRTVTAITDFEYLIKRYEQDPGVFSEELYRMILYFLGKAYKRMDMEKEARSTWHKLLSSCSEAKYKDLLREELSDTRVESSLPEDISRLSPKELFNEGVRLHDLAVKGNGKAAQKAFEVFKKLYEEDPDDSLVEGYYGSSLALAGRYSRDSQAIFSNAVEGLKHLRQAVSKNRDNVTLRLSLAYLLYSLPDSFFHFSGKAAKEFKFLISAYEKDNSLLPQECYWQMLYDLGVCYERCHNMEKAQKAWKKLLKTCPDPKYRSLLSTKFEGSVDK